MMALVHGNSMNLGVLHRGSAAQAYYAIPHVYTKFKPAGFASPTCQQAQHGDCVGSQVLDAQTDRTSFAPPSRGNEQVEAQSPTTKLYPGLRPTSPQSAGAFEPPLQLFARRVQENGILQCLEAMAKTAQRMLEAAELSLSQSTASNALFRASGNGALSTTSFAPAQAPPSLLLQNGYDIILALLQTLPCCADAHGPNAAQAFTSVCSALYALHSALMRVADSAHQPRGPYTELMQAGLGLYAMHSPLRVGMAEGDLDEVLESLAGHSLWHFNISVWTAVQGSVSGQAGLQDLYRLAGLAEQHAGAAVQAVAQAEAQLAVAAATATSAAATAATTDVSPYQQAPRSQGVEGVDACKAASSSPVSSTWTGTSPLSKHVEAFHAQSKHLAALKAEALREAATVTAYARMQRTAGSGVKVEFDAYQLALADFMRLCFNMAANRLGQASQPQLAAQELLEMVRAHLWHQQQLTLQIQHQHREALATVVPIAGADATAAHVPGYAVSHWPAPQLTMRGFTPSTSWLCAVAQAGLATTNEALSAKQAFRFFSELQDISRFSPHAHGHSSVGPVGHAASRRWLEASAQAAVEELVVHHAHNANWDTSDTLRVALALGGSCRGALGPALCNLLSQRLKEVSQCLALEAQPRGTLHLPCDAALLSSMLAQTAEHILSAHANAMQSKPSPVPEAEPQPQPAALLAADQALSTAPITSAVSPMSNGVWECDSSTRLLMQLGTAPPASGTIIPATCPQPTSSATPIAASAHCPITVSMQLPAGAPAVVIQSAYSARVHSMSALDSTLVLAPVVSGTTLELQGLFQQLLQHVQTALADTTGGAHSVSPGPTPSAPTATAVTASAGSPTQPAAPLSQGLSTEAVEDALQSQLPPTSSVQQGQAVNGSSPLRTLAALRPSPSGGVSGPASNIRTGGLALWSSPTFLFDDYPALLQAAHLYGYPASSLLVEDYARHLQSYLASSPVQELVRAGPEGLARALTLACAHTRCVQDAAWMTDCERACVMLVELQFSVGFTHPKRWQPLLSAVASLPSPLAMPSLTAAAKCMLVRLCDVDKHAEYFWGLLPVIGRLDRQVEVQAERLSHLPPRALDSHGPLSNSSISSTASSTVDAPSASNPSQIRPMGHPGPMIQRAAGGLGSRSSSVRSSSVRSTSVRSASVYRSSSRKTASSSSSSSSTYSSQAAGKVSKLAPAGSSGLGGASGSGSGAGATSGGAGSAPGSSRSSLSTQPSSQQPQAASSQAQSLSLPVPQQQQHSPAAVVYLVEAASKYRMADEEYHAWEGAVGARLAASMAAMAAKERAARLKELGIGMTGSK